MPTTPFTNPGPAPVHLGGKLIRPGETRDVDAALLQTRKPAQPVDVAASPVDTLAALRAESVKAIAERLPGLTDAELVDLTAAEAAEDRPRSTLLDAIAGEQLRRETLD